MIYYVNEVCGKFLSLTSGLKANFKDNYTKQELSKILVVDF